ncbi:MAG TPA: trehalose-phosphatase [Gemmatimonadaceae bacterium]
MTTRAPKGALPPSAELTERVSRSPFLVALDIDGTIAPITPTPDVSTVPATTRRILERLARAPDVHLAFVTGRAARDGRRLVDVTHSWTIGNHGIEMIDPTGALRVSQLAEAFAPTIAEAAMALAEPLAAIRGVFIEDKTWTLSVHVRLAARAEVPAVERALTEVARRLELRLHQGKQIFELRPPIAIDKGTALLDLAAALGVSDRGGSLDGSLLYAGDDKTDEDAFRALRARQWNTVTVHIGEGAHTDAEFVLPDPAALGDLLEWLASMRERRPAST